MTVVNLLVVVVVRSDDGGVQWFVSLMAGSSGEVGLLIDFGRDVNLEIYQCLVC